MLADMGTPGSLPKDDKDVIDMMSVLQELTFSSAERRGNVQTYNLPLNVFYWSLIMLYFIGVDMDADEDAKETLSSRAIEDGTPTVDVSQQKPSVSRGRADNKSESKAPTELELEPEMLHTGGVLGDLPSLKSPTKSPNKYDDYTASGKKKKPSTMPNQMNVPADTPKEFICELCQRMMSDPVKTVYGNTFEKAVIMDWMSKQGHICPLTGAPLSETDLTPLPELKTKIQKWILQRSMSDSNRNTAEENKPDGSGKMSPTKTKPPAEDDDLYDF
jgi:hypothetical protein